VVAVDKKLAKLEKTLLEGEEHGKEGGIDLIQGALIASRIQTGEEFDRYLAMIDLLYQRISDALFDLIEMGSDSKKAKEIFHWLWRVKPHRYEYGGSFRLTEVLEAQLGGKGRGVEDGGSVIVGNCLGLTLLYNVLARRFGLTVRAVHLEDAFGLGPHLFTVLYTGDRTIDIENIFPDGFDYRGHSGASKREEWGDRELIADIYHSVANDFFVSGKWECAIENYDKAIMLHPKYIRAHLNRGIALVELGRVEEAREWFRDRAV
jgi:tetratricopeptide (TPR) repeat protein